MPIRWVHAVHGCACCACFACACACVGNAVRLHAHVVHAPVGEREKERACARPWRAYPTRYVYVCMHACPGLRELTLPAVLCVCTQLNTMLSHGTTCLADMQKLLASCRPAIEPTISTYNALLVRMQIEGRSADDVRSAIWPLTTNTNPNPNPALTMYAHPSGHPTPMATPMPMLLMLTHAHAHMPMVP